MDMEDREKELEELIRLMAENTGIPAAIHPDAVEKKLEAAKTEKKRRLRRKYITGAVLCVSVHCSRYCRQLSALLAGNFRNIRYDGRLVGQCGRGALRQRSGRKSDRISREL